MDFVPRTYEEWEHCITVKCGIPLTADYLAGRIAALEDGHDFHTGKFIERWGPAHHARTLAWFRQAESRLADARGAARQ
ncbi:hypothetical protein [Paracoccus sp. S3-43]|uniref:hypothetical protein n=1 Tax=Paracoccus sp. S3-43 TaxID=3030011 RepID=UPI0023AFE46A|nr:hypothetical protein [Paracoccus sp. S3-43]WEF24875.1 hypothetical protein PXD02_02660 [Paracoccus sp. S3-43]